MISSGLSQLGLRDKPIAECLEYVVIKLHLMIIFID